MVRRMCTTGEGGRVRRTKGWFLTGGEHSAISTESGGGAKLFAEGKGVSEARSPRARVRRRKDETATEVERTGAEREGSGKVGRPGIDRLKKGWIFLPLGGGPAV